MLGMMAALATHLPSEAVSTACREALEQLLVDTIGKRRSIALLPLVAVVTQPAVEDAPRPTGLGLGLDWAPVCFDVLDSFLYCLGIWRLEWCCRCAVEAAC